MNARAALTRFHFAVLALVIALMLTSCGSDDEGSGDSLTKAEYIERADAICQELYRQRDPLEIQAAKAAQEGDSGRAAAVFDNAAEITRNRIAELRELPVPEGDEEVVEEVLSRGDATAETARAAAEAIRAEDSQALSEEAAQGRRITTRFDRAAVEYGFFVCGRGAGAEIG